MRSSTVIIAIIDDTNVTRFKEVVNMIKMTCMHVIRSASLLIFSIGKISPQTVKPGTCT